jgi:ubiquinone/menaquinone biosynthesis C-methylase UbiE
VAALDPSPNLLNMARKALGKTATSVELLQASAEAIPLEDESIDTIVTTWTLYSIPDVARALGEAHRVLKPHSRLLFVEHGLSPDAGVRKWQDWLTPAWKCIGGGCHLSLPIEELIKRGGSRIERLTTGT